MTLGERVKAARKHAKLTQVQLAAKVGVSQQVLARLEGDGATGTKALAMIAAECSVSPRWLATGDGHMLDGSAPTEAVSLSPRELALIANYRASGAEDRAKLERFALGVAQQAPEYARKAGNGDG